VIVKPVLTTQLFVTATTALNCTVKDSIQIKVFSPFTASVPVSNYYICPTESVQLSINPPNKVVSWAPVTGLSNSNSYKPVATPMQHTIYTATITDSANCFRSTASVDIVVKTPPTVNAGPDVSYPYNTTFYFAPIYSGNIDSYLWKPSESINCNDCAVPTGVAEETKVYTKTVVSDSGCVAFDSIRIGVQCSDASMFMASAFTPNNDNLNDYYYPLVKGIKLVKRFAIFNRFGEIVFEAKNFAPNDKTFGWNGKYKGQDQPFSTYLYILDAVCELGETIQKHGSFVLMR
jgi:gliding motility-associated-like protein